MKRNDIISELCNTGFIEKYMRQQCFETDEDRIKDFAQEIYVILLSDDPEGIEQMYEEGGLDRVKVFAAGIIKRQLTLSHSLIHRKYRKYDRSMTSDLEESGCVGMYDTPSLQDFEDACAEYLNDWERYAINTYRECGYDPEAVANECGVSKRLVDLVIYAIINKLKKGMYDNG